MFKVILTNGCEDLELSFKVRDTDIAQKWFIELQKDYDLFETDRFSNWGNKNHIADINNQIDIINSYQQIIDKKVNNLVTQQDLNYLHKFFEDLRGEVSTGTVWFHQAPVQIQSSLNRLNILIHQLESELRTKGNHPTLVVTFKDRPRVELSNEDCKHFTYFWKSGTAYINYCHVGKTVLDAFTNHDNITEAIRPQTHYSSDFMIKFGPSTNFIIYVLRSIIIKIWIKFKKLNFKNLNIGMIPVADLVTQVDKQTLLKFHRVKEVKCNM